MTVRELQTIKKKYSKALGRIAELEASEPQPKEVVKEVIKEVRVTPPDYQEALQKARETKARFEAYAERNAFLEQQLQDFYAKSVPKLTKNQLSMTINQSYSAIARRPGRYSIKNRELQKLALVPEKRQEMLTTHGRPWSM